MNIHEYQAKKLLAGFGIPVSKGEPVLAASDIDTAIDSCLLYTSPSPRDS